MAGSGPEALSEWLKMKIQMLAALSSGRRIFSTIKYYNVFYFFHCLAFPESF